ncbi:hypothetical protein GC097_11670 [Paenibacillus sp. LMG 31457]|uniref:Transposase DDE domain-containing protein n=1 Tax=Paenibacillus planticolens TaxID=2654976 RepID=A0ABX1ZKQ1_9BACL|nr:hypothetical protein [Paenibacillus planticolens]
MVNLRYACIRSVNFRRHPIVGNWSLFHSELKNRHGYDVADSSGLLGMQIQGAMAIFAVNLKRIMKMAD